MLLLSIAIGSTIWTAYLYSMEYLAEREMNRTT